MNGNVFSDSSYVKINNLNLARCLIFRQLNDFNTYAIYPSEDEVDRLGSNVRTGVISLVDEYTLVKHYENRIDGVAKQSGASGDTIEVYTPIMVS